MPFSKGEAFEMVIVVTSQGYQVSTTTSPKIPANPQALLNIKMVYNTL